MHEDPLPHLQEQLVQLESAGRQSEASAVMVKLANETSKRERWTVSSDPVDVLDPSYLIS